MVMAIFSEIRGVESWWCALTRRISRIQPCSPCSAAWRLHSGETCGRSRSSSSGQPISVAHMRESSSVFFAWNSSSEMRPSSRSRPRSRIASVGPGLARPARDDGPRVAHEAGEVLAGLAGEAAGLVDHALELGGHVAGGLAQLLLWVGHAGRLAPRAP